MKPEDVLNKRTITIDENGLIEVLLPNEQSILQTGFSVFMTESNDRIPGLIPTDNVAVNKPFNSVNSLNQKIRRLNLRCESNEVSLTKQDLLKIATIRFQIIKALQTQIKLDVKLSLVYQLYTLFCQLHRKSSSNTPEKQLTFFEVIHWTYLSIVAEVSHLNAGKLQNQPIIVETLTRAHGLYEPSACAVVLIALSLADNKTLVDWGLTEKVRQQFNIKGFLDYGLSTKKLIQHFLGWYDSKTHYVPVFTYLGTKCLGVLDIFNGVNYLYQQGILNSEQWQRFMQKIKKVILSTSKPLPTFIAQFDSKKKQLPHRPALHPRRIKSDPIELNRRPRIHSNRPKVVWAYDSIHQAAIKSDKFAIAKYLNEGGDINATDDDNKTLLHYATQYADLDCVVFLVGKGADVTKESKSGLNALYYAAIRHFGKDQIAKINFFLDNKLLGFDDELVRHTCLGNIEYLKNNIEDQHKTKRYLNGATILHFACGMGHQVIVEWLIRDLRWTFTQGDKYTVTPYFYAVINQHASLVQWFLENDYAKLSDLSTGNQTALHVAAHLGYSDVTKVLLSKATLKDLIAKDAQAYEPFRRAVAVGHLAVLKSFFAKDKRCIQSVSYKESLLRLAIIEGHFFIVQWLLNNRRVNVPNYDHPLWHAAFYSHVSLCQLFIDSSEKCDIHFKPSYVPSHALRGSIAPLSGTIKVKTPKGIASIDFDDLFPSKKYLKKANSRKSSGTDKETIYYINKYPFTKIWYRNVHCILDQFQNPTLIKKSREIREVINIIRRHPADKSISELCHAVFRSLIHYEAKGLLETYWGKLADCIEKLTPQQKVDILNYASDYDCLEEIETIAYREKVNTFPKPVAETPVTQVIQHMSVNTMHVDQAQSLHVGNRYGLDKPSKSQYTAMGSTQNYHPNRRPLMHHNPLETSESSSLTTSESEATSSFVRNTTDQSPTLASKRSNKGPTTWVGRTEELRRGPELDVPEGLPPEEMQTGASVLAMLNRSNLEAQRDTGSMLEVGYAAKTSDGARVKVNPRQPAPGPTTLPARQSNLPQQPSVSPAHNLQSLYNRGPMTQPELATSEPSQSSAANMVEGEDKSGKKLGKG